MPKLAGDGQGENAGELATFFSDQALRVGVATRAIFTS